MQSNTFRRSLIGGLLDNRVETDVTYDRYLLRNFLHTFFVCFISTYGLYAVIDLFENFDEMIAINGNNGSLSLVTLIATLNFYQSIIFLDQAGPTLTVIAVMTVLILLQRSGELHPLLAAGIPMYRVLRPMILGAVVVNGLLMLNQECFLPRVAFLYHDLRHRNDASQSEVESLTDHTTRIWIDGHRVNVAERTIEHPTFVLPIGLVKNPMPLDAEIAKFYPAKKRHPAGWMLKKLTKSTAEIAKELTDRGRELVKIQNNEEDVFIVSAITCDQLFRRSSSYTSLSTADLLARIQCPAFGLVTIKRLTLYLHTRFMKPFMNVIAVLLAIPLMVRRESPGLVADSSLCGFVLAVVFVITQAFQSLGSSNVIPPELAAWAPVVIGGSLSAWLSGVIRT